jgi:hypothetical protein
MKQIGWAEHQNEADGSNRRSLERERFIHRKEFRPAAQAKPATSAWSNGNW